MGAGETKYGEQLGLDVGDVPGHQIRVARLQTTYTDNAPVVDGVKAVSGFSSPSGARVRVRDLELLDELADVSCCHHRSCTEER